MYTTDAYSKSRRIPPHYAAHAFRLEMQRRAALRRAANKNQPRYTGIRLVCNEGASIKLITTKQKPIVKPWKLLLKNLIW